MQERFSSTFAMMDEMNALMGGALAPGEARLTGNGKTNDSPLAALNALMQGGFSISRSGQDKRRIQDSREKGAFIARDSPASSDFYNLAERYESATGSTKALERALRDLIVVDPDYYDPYLMLRDLLTKTGREAEGEALLSEAYRRALARITDASGAWPRSLEWGWRENRHIIRTLLNQALADWTAGRTEAALDLLRKLLRSNPNDNIGAREYILAIRMGETFAGFEDRFMAELGYDGLKMTEWFDENSPRFPDDFDWWKQAVGYEA